MGKFEAVVNLLGIAF